MLGIEIVTILGALIGIATLSFGLLKLYDRIANSNKIVGEGYKSVTP